MTDTQATAVEKLGEPIAGDDKDPTAGPTSDSERRRAQWRERKRRQRERQKLGTVLVKILVFEDAVDAALQRGEICEEEVDNRDLLSAFIEDDVNSRLLKGDSST